MSDVIEDVQKLCSEYKMLPPIAKARCEEVYKKAILDALISRKTLAGTETTKDKVLEFIKSSANGVTKQAVAAKFGIKPNSAYAHCYNLQKAGLVKGVSCGHATSLKRFVANL